MAVFWSTSCGWASSASNPRSSRWKPVVRAIIVMGGLWGFLSGVLLPAAPIESNPTAPKESASDRRPQEVLDAIKRFEGGNADGAFESLKAASAKHPNLAPPRVMMANLYITDRQRAAGLQQLELAAVENPNDPETHLIFGDIAQFERRLSDAAAQYEAGRALLAKFNADAGRKASLTSQCQLGLAAVAKLRGQWEAARKELSQLLETQPNNATAHQRMAETLVAAGKPDEALKELRAAVKADRKLPPSASLMAEIYQQSGKATEVKKWLTRAVEESPDDVRSRLAMGKWLLDEGLVERAAAEFAAAEKIDPKLPEVKLWVGTAARFLHDDKKARECFEAVLEQAPGNFSASDQLALLSAEQRAGDKLSHALEMATANLRNAPQSIEAESTLGWIDFKLGNLDDAERHLRAAMRGTISRDTAYFLAKLAFERGRRDDALRLLRQAIDSKGPFVHADDASRWLAQLTKSNEASQK